MPNPKSARRGRRGASRCVTASSESDASTIGSTAAAPARRCRG
jgi:hypothetical protein